MIKDLLTESFESDVVRNTRPVVIKASAVWCGPCVQLAPVFKQVAQEFDGRVDFFELNVDQARDLAIQFGITSIPSILFLKDGQIMQKEVGYVDADELRKRVEHFLSALK